MSDIVQQNPASPSTQEIETFVSAAAEGNMSKVQEFLSRWPKQIDAANAHSWTALMQASWKGREAVVLLLLSKGADIELKDRWGRTSWLLARMQGNKAVMELIRKPRARETTEGQP